MATVATSAGSCIIGATHNAVGGVGGAALGFVQAWSVDYTPVDSSVVGEGATGNQATYPVHEEVTVVLTFLVPPFILPTVAAATMVLTAKDHAGATQTITILQMKPRGIAHAAVVQGMAMWTQHFVYVGTMATFPITLTP